LADVTGATTKRPFVFLLILTAACESPPSADSLREWSANDHHSADDDKLGGAGAPRQGAPAPKGNDTPQLVELAWRQQCVACHGAMGKGDGPTGPMVQAPDLTSGELQAKVSDAELAAIIKGGKGKMPKFDLPDPVVQGLVAKIRQLKGR
jgi:cytochrome c oxidase cbb3-type subunit 3